jgi:hypothetical protein
MPYVYVGLEPIHHGRKLLKLLSNLKNFGRGRIVYRCDEQNHPEPSFYRILLAQPEMDEKLEEGRVVVEQVHRGVRYTKPVNLSGKLREFFKITSISPSELSQSTISPNSTKVYHFTKQVLGKLYFFTK